MGHPQTLTQHAYAVITRRRLITGGLAAAALGAAGLVYGRYTELGDDDRVIVAAIAPVMLGIPHSGAQVARGVDIAISGLPLEVRAQIHQLFGILRFAPARILVAGVRHPWRAANADEVAHFLSAWRYSRVTQLRSAYDALHQLIMASWYGNDASWNAIGYAGPPNVAR